MRALEIVGQRFSRLVVIERAENRGKFVFWKCQCDCGREKEVRTSHLTGGNIKSCGCLNSELATAMMTKHGGAPAEKSKRHPLYSIWCGMRKRCYSANCDGYPYYGGRGIEVCAEWNASFETFVRDMGDRPSSSHTLDRRDNDKDYGPDNCRWATRAEQSKNRRPYGSTKIVKTIKGKSNDQARRQASGRWA